MTKRKYTISEIDDLLKKYDEGDLKFLYFVDADFSGLDLTNKIFIHVHFIRCNFKNCNLSNVVMPHCVFEYCDFTGAHLYGISLSNAMMIRPKGISFFSVDHIGSRFEGRIIYIPEINHVEMNMFRGTLDDFRSKVDGLSIDYEDNRLELVYDYFQKSRDITFTGTVNTHNGADFYDSYEISAGLDEVFGDMNMSQQELLETLRYLLGE